MKIPMLATLATVVGLLLVPAAHADVTSKGITAAYNSWVTELETADGDGTTVARQYTKNAILLATFSKYLKGRTAIHTYFDDLTANDNLKVRTDRITTGHDGEMGYATGLYTFSYTDEAGKTVKVPARFTFVFLQNDDGQYLIANHHSSVNPKK